MSSHSNRRAVVLALSLLASACATTAARPSLSESTLPPTTTSPPTSDTGPAPTDSILDPTPLIGTLQYEVVATYDHDPDAFTQGLEFVGEDLYESTGLRGESDLRIVDPESGVVRALTPLNSSFFGEGLTERDGVLYQLTWTSGVVLRSTAADLEPVGTPLVYSGEGWGLCSLESEPNAPFVMSNGSAELTVRNPDTFEVERRIPVTDEAGEPVLLLNELECVGPNVLANIWQSNDIISIDLTTGQVVGRLDLSALVPIDAENVLNGIAYRPATDTYFVTGKLWPVMYELSLSSG